MWIALAVATTLAAVTVPEAPEGRVNDYANVLSAGNQRQLEAKLAEWERRTSNQVVVVTLPSLEGEDIADVAYRFGQAWGLGQRNRDNGVLLLVAMAERRDRIEVGKGLEGALTDLESSIILNDVMKPLLAQGRAEDAILYGTDAILTAVKGEYRAYPQKVRVKPMTALLFAGFLLVLFIFFPRAGMFLLFALGNRRGGGFGDGGFRGGGGRFGGGGASGSW